MTRAQTHGDYPPETLRQYALIADGERGALCGPQGELVWMCAPRWHDDAVFASLIGGSGAYAVTPRSRCVWSGQYEPGSLIWRNRWTTVDNDIIECRDALAAPAGPRGAVLLRRIEALKGAAHMTVALMACAGFGSERMRDLRHRDGVWTARTGTLRLRWTGAGDATVDDDGRLTIELTVSEGGHHDLVLEIANHPLVAEPVRAADAWQQTEQFWAHEVPAFDDCAAPRDTRHAYAVLRGMTSSSGGMVAAATMSLPERADQGNNYDYRYAWIRDQCFAGLAVAADGPHPLLQTGVEFISERILADGPDLRPGYLVNGGSMPAESELPLKGYPGGWNVRGNKVTHQFQLDVFGEVLNLFAAARRHDQLGRDALRAARVAVEAIERRWTEPDAGIWELDDQWWTHSRLACVSGLRAYAAGAPDAERSRLRELASAMLTETTRRCLHPDGFWQRTPDDQRVDSALLLPAVRGGFRADDPRAIATLDAVQRDLVDDGYVYRYRPAGRTLGEKEGAFLLCGFVLALAQLRAGRVIGAYRCFERNRAASGTPGLLSEEFDVEQRQLRGNLPQAFVHAMLLETSVRLAADSPTEGN
ncbi:MAG TPA: glycoside hydrolase family 15 protein [Jatrophihabitantaceae bacterium]|nr:glycoside hydrolase family 15 protein [Jatrophihabitantaceae bacterium]